MRADCQLAGAVRRAVTLVELIVVITLLGVLATLVAFYVVPAFQDNKNVQRGVDKVTTALLIAKQRSLRDQSPRGLRFVVDNPGDPPAQHRCSQIVYIEQPEAFRTGRIKPVQNMPNRVLFLPPDKSSAGTANLWGTAGPNNFAEHLVQKGDFFRLEVGTPTNYEIDSVPTQDTIQLLRALNPPLQDTKDGTLNYRIIRQPRPIAGESPVDLPTNVVVDLGFINQLAPGNQVTTRTLPGNQLAYDVLFDPAGGVMNRSSAAIVLWLRDATEPLPPLPMQSDPKPHVNLLIAVYPRTGFVAAHPVADRTNPLQFAIDGRSSGM